MKWKFVFAFVSIIYIIFVMYLAIISGYAETSNNHGSSTALPKSVPLPELVTPDTKTQIFGKAADYFDNGKKLLDWDLFDKNKSEEMGQKDAVHIQCDADHKLNFFTVDDENGKRFDKLIAQMATDLTNDNFSVDSDNWRNVTIVLEMSVLIPVSSSEKYAVCVSRCNHFDEDCKSADLDHNLDDVFARMSKVMSLSFNISSRRVDCSGFSDYFRAQDAQIDILTWEDQVVRSQDVMRFMKKGSVRMYGLFDFDEILKAKGVRCTLHFQHYRNRNIEMEWYLFILLVAIPSAFTCVAFCCFFHRFLVVFYMNDFYKCNNEKMASVVVEDGGTSKGGAGGGCKGSQIRTVTTTSLQLFEIQKSKGECLDVEAMVILKQPPPPPSHGAVKGKKVRVKIYELKFNEQKAIPLGIVRPSLEHENGEKSGGKIENASVVLGEILGSSASVGANRTE